MQRELFFHPQAKLKIKNASADSEVQIQQIEQLLEEGIDLLIVAPNESVPLTPTIEKVFDAGIPVVLVDRTTLSEKYTAFVGADNYAIGKTAANFIANIKNGAAQILELQMSMSISPAKDRSKGFRDHLEGVPDLQVVGTLEVDTKIENIDERLPALLKEHPDANVIFGHTDLIAERAYKILDEQNRADEFIFVGIDGIPSTGLGVKAVEQGILDASLIYPTGGVEAIRLVLAILNNIPYAKNNLLHTTVIDQSNAQILRLQTEKMYSLQREIDGQVDIMETLNLDYQRQRSLIGILISGIALVLILGFFLAFSLRAKQLANRKLSLINKEVLHQKAALIEKQDEIIAMSDEVERATKAKVNFFTNISHEFRTPLTLILAFTEDLLLNKELMNKAIKSSIVPIRDNALRLLRLVTQLMDFRKTEANKMQVYVAENDLIEFVQNILNSYYRIAEKRSIDLIFKARQEKLDLWFDPNILDKVLFNLLSNAFKFTPDGGEVSVLISVDHFDKLVMIKVEDTGEGMTKEEMERVFEPFYQGGKANQNFQMGTGIGLPLSRALMKLHKGHIKVKSRKDKGSQFIVVLPLEKEVFNLAQDSTEKIDYQSNHQSYLEVESESIVPYLGNELKKEGPRILLIEDNKELIKFLSKRLNDKYSVIPIEDGLIGLERAFEEIPDLIICDINLPGANGIEITKQLKTDLRTSHIPIVLLTARTDIEQQIAGARVGADAYITKPFHIQLLREKIINLINNRQILKEVYSSHIHDFQQYQHLSSLDQVFIKKFASYVNENYMRQDFQVLDLCEEMQLSRSQLYRKIKALLGQSISDYCQNIRLSKAEQLLQNPDLNISDIAYQVGYTSPDYFAKVFKSKYNIAPLQYRKVYFKNKQQD
ncbi:MAG: substrate-binding domain-containing protein [Saprospiraceae bacterium]